MSELEQLHPPEPAPADQRHGGVLLREQRVASGMHIVGLSAVLKVPVSRLEALEAGRFDELPDLIFARALASSVCRVLKTDPAPILAALPMPAAPVQVAPVASVDPHQPLRPQGGPPLGGHAARRQRRYWVLLLLLFVLALLASGAWWWPQPAPPAATAEPVPTESPPLSAPVVAHAPAQAAEIALASAEPDRGVLSSPSPAASALQPPVLRLSVTQVTWVQVAGATGALRLERTLQPGESLDISDDLPLQVVVGRADAVEVQVRGQRLDLAPYARNQVARFEVR